jgi:YesN/AraC family two-component response regulator
MKLFIKNLVTHEDKQWLRNTLNELLIPYDNDFNLGEITLLPMVEPERLLQLKNRLAEKGLSIIYDRKTVLTEQIKLVINEIFRLNQSVKENYSVYISNRLHLNYTYLANIFSELTGTTIEHYIIDRKIEVAKKLLLNGIYNIGQIADTLHYSSIGHFSNQFKKVTGLNPSEFKKKERDASAVG